MCGMIISDPRYAEIRGGPDRALVKFDDIGDAVNWLDMQSWRNDPAIEFWVMDDTGTEWLDARTAFYMPGTVSPMDYGFAAVKQKTDKTVDFAAMSKTALARGMAGRCAGRGWPPVTSSPVRGLWLALRLEVQESLRSRWFFLYALVFFGLMALLALTGISGSRVLGFTGLSRLLVTYIQITMAVLPLFILVTTALAGGRPRGRQSRIYAVLSGGAWASGAQGKFLGRFLLVVFPVASARCFCHWSMARCATWPAVAACGALCRAHCRACPVFPGACLLRFKPGALHRGGAWCVAGAVAHPGGAARSLPAVDPDPGAV